MKINRLSLHDSGLKLALLVSIIALVGQVGWPIVKAWCNRPREGQTVSQTWATTPSGMAGEYLIRLPTSYEADPQRRWPLVLALHGSGNRGADINEFGHSGFVEIFQEQGALPAIVVIPQCLPDNFWQAESLLTALAQLETRYQISPDQISVFGYSMGAYGALGFGGPGPRTNCRHRACCGRG